MDSNNIGYTLVAIGDITYCVVFVFQNSFMLLESDHYFFLCVCLSVRCLFEKKEGSALLSK